MDIAIRKYIKSDAEQAILIWNKVVEVGAAFLQIERLTVES